MRRPCSDASHVTAPYKLSFYYYYYYYYYYLTAIRVESMYMIKSWLKTRKKRKCGYQRNVSVKFHLKDAFGIGIHNFLRRPDARESADVNYRISLLCESGKIGHASNINYQRIILRWLCDTLIWLWNLISLASFNSDFFIILYWLILGHPYRMVN